MEQIKQFILIGTEKPSEREEWILRNMNRLLEIDAVGVMIAFADDEKETDGFAVHHLSIANMLNVSRGALTEAVNLLGVSLDEDDEIMRRFYEKLCKLCEDFDSVFE